MSRCTDLETSINRFLGGQRALRLALRALRLAPAPRATVGSSPGGARRRHRRRRSPAGDDRTRFAATARNAASASRPSIEIRDHRAASPPSRTADPNRSISRACAPTRFDLPFEAGRVRPDHGVAVPAPLRPTTTVVRLLSERCAHSREPRGDRQRPAATRGWPWAFDLVPCGAQSRGYTRWFAHDGPVSVLRGFTDDELLCRQRVHAGAHDATVRRSVAVSPAPHLSRDDSAR